MTNQPTYNTQEKQRNSSNDTKNVPKILQKQKHYYRHVYQQKEYMLTVRNFRKRVDIMCFIIIGIIQKNSNLRSVEIKFPFLYQSQEPIEFIFSQSQYTTIDQQSKVGWEFYCGFSQFSVNWTKETEYVVNFRHFGLDCSVTDPHIIIKLDTTVRMLRYEEGYFVEEKLMHYQDSFDRMFTNLLLQNIKTDYLKRKLFVKGQISLSYSWKIYSIDFQQKGFESQFIKGFIEPQNISTIKITQIPQFIKELHYLDNLYTGYVSLEELKLVIKYYNKQKVEEQEWQNVNVQNKRLLLLVDPEFDIIKKDFVIKKRGFYEKKWNTMNIYLLICLFYGKININDIYSQ